MATTASAIQYDRDAPITFGGTATVDLPSIAAGALEVLTIPVPGVRVTDTAVVNPWNAPTSGITVANVRCAANQIVVQVRNESGGAIDEAAGTWTWRVWRGRRGAITGA